MSKQIPVGDPKLPAPGDARDEELRKRADTLAEEAERRANEQELHTVDAAAMQIDNELAQHYNPMHASMLTVSNPQQGWTYAWANFVNQAGVQVMMKKTDGWVVVSGTDPESVEHKGTDGTRRIGDVLLMRIPTAKKEELDRRDELFRQRQEKGVMAELEEYGRKHRDKGLRVHSPNEGTSPHAFARKEQSYDPRHQIVKQEATRALGEMSREKIPGVPLPGEKT
jgi:hypothetical protein